MIRTERSNNGLVGRKPNGQFAKGNKLSKGNKSHWNEKAQKLKKALTDAITEKDIKEIAKGLVKKAKQGDTSAAKEIFDRLWGKASQQVEIESVAEARVLTDEQAAELLQDRLVPCEDAIAR
ncbi:MAG: hypothetical protein ACYTBV_19485 [Planctomycetota bacterium]|jgi:hypothetical protein